MLAIIRQLMKFFKKEHLLVSRYERSHPHFLWFLGLDAILSIGLIFGAFYLFTYNNSTAQNLLHSGSVPMVADKFVIHIKENHVSAYWLGPIPGNQYTVNHMEPGVTEVFYTSAGSDVSHLVKYNFKVTEYRDASTFTQHVQPLTERGKGTPISVTENISLQIGESSMKSEIVTFKNLPIVVSVTYPVPQTVKTMIRDAQLLKPIE